MPLRVALWVLGAVMAALGIVAAIVMASPWPLVTIAGLAVPLMPVGRTHARR